MISTPLCNHLDIQIIKNIGFEDLFHCSSYQYHFSHSKVIHVYRTRCMFWYGIWQIGMFDFLHLQSSILCDTLSSMINILQCVQKFWVGHDVVSIWIRYAQLNKLSLWTSSARWKFQTYLQHTHCCSAMTLTFQIDIMVLFATYHEVVGYNHIRIINILHGIRKFSWAGHDVLTTCTDKQDDNYIKNINQT